jgi:tRNA 2-thiouridine synthesizing protein A
MADFKIDARFLLCPLPVLKAQKKLKSMNTGDTLTIIGTSDGGIDEFRLFCSQTNIYKIIDDSEGSSNWSVRLLIE